jgi:hypothetical protein
VTATSIQKTFAHIGYIDKNVFDNEDESNVDDGIRDEVDEGLDNEVDYEINELIIR